MVAATLKPKAARQGLLIRLFQQAPICCDHSV